MPPQRQRLSGLDSAFVYGESQRIPLHVGSLALLDATPTAGSRGWTSTSSEFARGIARRLHLIPRFRQRLLEVPYDLARPVWVDDPAFRIEDHVHLTAVPRPGSRRQLLALMGTAAVDRHGSDPAAVGVVVRRRTR